MDIERQSKKILKKRREDADLEKAELKVFSNTGYAYI